MSDGELQWSNDLIQDELDWVMKCNLYAPITLMRGFVRHWLGMSTQVCTPDDAGKPSQPIHLNKRILCVSSISGLVNMNPQHQVAYNASKAGLTMACRVSGSFESNLPAESCR